MNKYFLAASLLAATISAFGQEDNHSGEIKRINISDLYIQVGTSSQGVQTGTIDDFRQLAPQSVLLSNDFEEYNTSTGYYNTSNGIFSILLGIQFRDKEKKEYKTNPRLRLGVIYLSGLGMSAGASRQRTTTVDTLKSSQTNQVFYIDSVHSRSYYMQHAYDQIRLDGSILFTTDLRTRWSLFAGIGVAAGASLYSNTEVIYMESSEVQYPNQNIYSSSYSRTTSSESEFFRNKTNFGVSAYVPLGVDFRMGNKKEFWKMIHLFYELRPGITFTSIPELETISQATIQQGLGLRVSWN